jgi:hypothetical protein
MSPAAKRGPPSGVLSTLNWRFSLANHRPADEGQLLALEPFMAWPVDGSVLQELLQPRVYWG